MEPILTPFESWSYKVEILKLKPCISKTY